jgi:hypothetical protein
MCAKHYKMHNVVRSLISYMPKATRLQFRLILASMHSTPTSNTQDRAQYEISSDRVCSLYLLSISFFQNLKDLIV